MVTGPGADAKEPDIRKIPASCAKYALTGQYSKEHAELVKKSIDEILEGILNGESIKLVCDTTRRFEKMWLYDIKIDGLLYPVGQIVYTPPTREGAFRVRNFEDSSVVVMNEEYRRQFEERLNKYIRV